jgi:hypothetical protein
VLSYSRRIGLGIDDLRLADIALIGARGKRLTYRTVGRARPMETATKVKPRPRMATWIAPRQGELPLS